jgi:hypothetical protein
MTIGYAVATRNARLDAINTLLNAGSGAATLKIYAGTRPATGGTATTLLGTLTFSDPAAASASSGVLTFSAITQDSSADATGTATWARAADSAGTFVFDCSVTATGGGGDIQLNTTSIVIGGPISITSASITAGNA